MKTKNLIFAATTLLVTACSNNPSTEKYTVTGNIEGLPDSIHIQLIPVSHDIEKPIADTIVCNGSFTFTGKTEEPRAMRLCIDGAYGSRLLILENANININGKVIAQPENNEIFYDMSSLTITGSPLSIRYDSLMKVRAQMDSIHSINAIKHQSISQAIFEAHKNKNTKKIAELKASEAYKNLQKDESLFFHSVDSIYHQTVMNNKDSFWGPLLMISLTTYLNEDMKPWYESLSPQSQNSYYGQKVKEELFPAGKVGSQVPEFTVKNATEEEVSLTQLCKENKFILIDFWASWCNPCRKEIPNLKKLYHLYHTKGFEIISISIDKKRSDWEKALKEEQLPWLNILDETNVAELYKVKFVPSMFLIDSQCILVGDNLRGEELAKKLEKLFLE